LNTDCIMAKCRAFAPCFGKLGQQIMSSLNRLLLSPTLAVAPGAIVVGVVDQAHRLNARYPPRCERALQWRRKPMRSFRV
jgi:hypothetical protein